MSTGSGSSFQWLVYYIAPPSKYSRAEPQGWPPSKTVVKNPYSLCEVSEVMNLLLVSFDLGSHFTSKMKIFCICINLGIISLSMCVWEHFHFIRVTEVSSTFEMFQLSPGLLIMGSMLDISIFIYALDFST